MIRLGQSKQEHISYYCIVTYHSCKVSIFFPFTAFTLQKIPASDQCNHLLSRLLDSNLDQDLLEETKQSCTMIHNRCGLPSEQAFSLAQHPQYAWSSPSSSEGTAVSNFHELPLSPFTPLLPTPLSWYFWSFPLRTTETRKGLSKSSPPKLKNTHISNARSDLFASNLSSPSITVQLEAQS